MARRSFHDWQSIIERQEVSGLSVADIYLHVDAVDFRKSINGLIVVVEQQLELSPLKNFFLPISDM